MADRAVSSVTPEARALLLLMEDISERYWASGWYSGIEYDLWAKVTGIPWWWKGPTAQHIADLTHLSTTAGGWWCWDDDIQDTRFVPTAEWLERFASFVAVRDDPQTRAAQ